MIVAAMYYGFTMGKKATAKANPIVTPSYIKRPIAVSQEYVDHYRKRITEIKPSLPGLHDAHGNRWALVGIGSLGAKMYKSGPESYNNDQTFDFDVEQLYKNFKDTFKFDFNINENAIYINEEEYKRLKEIEALHNESLKELNNLFDPIETHIEDKSL